MHAHPRMYTGFLVRIPDDVQRKFKFQDLNLFPGNFILLKYKLFDVIYQKNALGNKLDC